MRATCGTTLSRVAVCWALCALALVLCAAPARAQAPEAPREVATCGGCTWLVVGGSPGALVKNGTCEADCSGYLGLDNKGIGSISEGAFQGLPQLQKLYLSGNGIQAIPEGAFQGLPQLQKLSLGGNGIQAISEGAFQGLPQLQDLSLDGNGIQAIPETAFQGLPLLQTLWLACRRAS
jgi:Leucine-rich repeat (LRR) protein